MNAGAKALFVVNAYRLQSYPQAPHLPIGIYFSTFPDTSSHHIKIDQF